MQDRQSALEVLVRAVQVAQKRGAYTLEEASVIHSAIAAFSEESLDNPSESPQDK